MFSVLRNLLILGAIYSSSAAKCEKMTALTYNTALFEQLTASLPITREDRRNKVIEELQTSSADLVCLQEVFFADDVKAIVDGVSERYRYSFSKIHNEDGTVDGSPEPTDAPLCDPVVFSALLTCLFVHCNVGTSVDVSVLACGIDLCAAEFTTVSSTSSEGCLTCFLASITASADGFFASCAGQGMDPVLKKVNAPGLLVLSRKKLGKKEFVDFFPETVELFSRGYLRVKVRRKIEAVCTHLSADFPVYLELNLMHRFNSYDEQNQYETNRLITAFGSKKKVLLLGDFNSGPSAPGGVTAVLPASYNALTATFNTAADGCTYCPTSENPFNAPDQNVIIDHIFGRGVEIKEVERVFTTAESTIVLDNVQLPYSDHFGVQAKIRKWKN